MLKIPDPVFPKNCRLWVLGREIPPAFASFYTFSTAFQKRGQTDSNTTDAQLGFFKNIPNFLANWADGSNKVVCYLGI